MSHEPSINERREPQNSAEDTLSYLFSLHWRDTLISIMSPKFPSSSSYIPGRTPSGPRDKSRPLSSYSKRHQRRIKAQTKANNGDSRTDAEIRNQELWDSKKRELFHRF